MRIEYRPGAWFAAAGDATLAVLDGGLTAATAARTWQVIADGGDLLAVLQELTASLGTSLAAMPPFCVATITGEDAHVAVRGSLIVRSDGAQITGTGAATWREQDMERPAMLEIDDGQAAPGDWLPLASGVVRAGAVRLVLRDEARGAAGDRVSLGRSTWSDSRLAEDESAPRPEGGADDASAGSPPRSRPPARGEAPAKYARMLYDATSLPDSEEGEAGRGDVASGAANANLAHVGDDDAWDGDDELGADDELVNDALADDDDLPPNAETQMSARKRRQLRADAARDGGDDEPGLIGPMPGADPRSSAVGELVLPNGERVELDRPAVIGRSPGPHPRAGDSAPHLVTVASPSQDISRSHLAVRPAGGQVIAIDLDSTNGTVLRRADRAPQRLPPGGEALVLDGDTLDLGDGVSIEYREAR